MTNDESRGIWIVIGIIELILGIVGSIFVFINQGFLQGIVIAIALLLSSFQCFTYARLIKNQDDIMGAINYMTSNMPSEKIDYSLIKGKNDHVKETDMSTIPDGSWICPNCGRSNPKYTGTCACGNSKP